MIFWTTSLPSALYKEWLPILTYDFFCLEKFVIVKNNQILKEKYWKYEDIEKLFDFLKTTKNCLCIKANDDKNEICFIHKFYHEFK